jgi:hypothetical protein
MIDESDMGDGFGQRVPVANKPGIAQQHSREDNMRKNLMAVGMLCGLTMIVVGCSSPHYRVNDPATGKAYYTTKVEDAGKGGAVKFKDDKSGSRVTLQSSEVRNISSDEYDAGLTQPVALPAVKKETTEVKKETTEVIKGNETTQKDQVK